MNAHAKNLEDAEFLLQTYNIDSLTELIEHIKKVMPQHECPKCGGKGFYSISYNAYPSGLPDSGWVFKQGWRDKQCDICNGEGYIDFEVVRIEKHMGSRVEYDGYCTKDGYKVWKEKELGEKPW